MTHIKSNAPTKTDHVDTSDYSILDKDVFKLICRTETSEDVFDETAALYCSTGCLVRIRIIACGIVTSQSTTFVPNTFIHETFNHEKKIVRRYIKESSNN